MVTARGRRLKAWLHQRLGWAVLAAGLPAWGREEDETQMTCYYTGQCMDIMSHKRDTRAFMGKL